MEPQQTHGKIFLWNKLQQGKCKAKYGFIPLNHEYIHET